MIKKAGWAGVPIMTGWQAQELIESEGNGKSQRRRTGVSALHINFNYCRLRVMSPCLLKVTWSMFSWPLVKSLVTKADWS
jgi:hypothetical protein